MFLFLNESKGLQALKVHVENCSRSTLSCEIFVSMTYKHSQQLAVSCSDFKRRWASFNSASVSRFAGGLGGVDGRGWGSGADMDCPLLTDSGRTI